MGGMAGMGVGGGAAGLAAMSAAMGMGMGGSWPVVTYHTVPQQQAQQQQQQQQHVSLQAHAAQLQGGAGGAMGYY